MPFLRYFLRSGRLVCALCRPYGDPVLGCELPATPNDVRPCALCGEGAS